MPDPTPVTPATTPNAIAQQVKDAAVALSNLDPNDPDAAHKVAQIGTLTQALVRIVSPWVSEKVQLVIVAIVRHRLWRHVVPKQD